jgi:uncharacterized protein with HEPN domain
MDKPLEARLHDLIETIDQTQTMMAGVDFQTFAADRLRRLAAERAIEIVADASRHVPEELKATAPHVHWEQMVEIREFLWDYYYAVDAELVWDVIRNDFPPLREFAQHVTPDFSIGH